MGLAIYLFIVVVVAAFLVYAWNDAEWRAWFKDSETLVYARVQIFASGVGGLMSLAALVAGNADFSPLFATGIPTGKQLFLFAITFLQGMLQEYLRKRREAGM